MKLMPQLQEPRSTPIEPRFAMLLDRLSHDYTSESLVQFLVFISQSVFKRAAMQIQRHDIGGSERALGQIRQEQ
jgi:hypothetical protein